MRDSHDTDAGSDPLDFTPVPTASTRHDGWTPARQIAFIQLLSTHGGVSAAARAIGMTPQSANRLRRRTDAESFAVAWDAALEEGRLRAYDQAMTYGREGRLVPVTRMGRLVGHRRVIDNRLLFAACYGEPLGRYGRDGDPPKPR
jgi:hypothetical protein